MQSLKCNEWPWWLCTGIFITADYRPELLNDCILLAILPHHFLWRYDLNSGLWWIMDLQIDLFMTLLCLFYFPYFPCKIISQRGNAVCGYRIGKHNDKKLECMIFVLKKNTLTKWTNQPEVGCFPRWLIQQKSFKIKDYMKDYQFPSY